METHAHDLHKAPGHGWKHYFFEFFMLFLAVSLGFYAENFREEMKNKKEIAADMQSMVNDLKADIAYGDSILLRNEYSCSMVDTLISLLHNNPSNTQQIYYVARIITANFGYFYTNSKTFDQMKSSGALKLIDPRNLLDSIGNYYVSFQFLSNQGELMRQKIDDIHTGNAGVFDTYTFQQMMHTDYGSFNGGLIQIHKPDGNPKLLTDDVNKINAAALGYHYFYSTTKFYDRAASIQRDRAARLVELIKKEYHLK
jgi:Family of unknown function (DUF6090)